ncbi:S53 family peptidase [Burkholderiaceae bacterium DAT-1]|nr:S53 family peptidase [Burkholderiaceae bacterium DAT-1]
MTFRATLFLTALASASATQTHAAGFFDTAGQTWGTARAGWMATETVAKQVTGSKLNELAASRQVPITITLQARNQDQLDRIVADQLTGTGRALTSAEMSAQFLPTQTDVSAVVTHLAQAGFHDIVVAENRMIITAVGNNKAVKAAFQTPLMSETSASGVQYFYNSQQVLVPSQLAGVVRSVTGLQSEEKLQTFMQMREIAPEMQFTRGMVSAAAVTNAVTYHYPAEFRTLYNANSLKPSTAAIAVIVQGNLTQTLADLKLGMTKAGVSSVNVITRQVGAASNDISNMGEWNLDTQTIVGISGGSLKSLTLYDVPTLSNSDILAGVNKFVSDNTAKILSISLGECEAAAKTSGFIAAMDAVFKIGVAQGQMFSVSTGDSGSSICGAKTVSYPATSPYVVAVGGTTLTTTSAGAYVSETAWKGSTGGNSAYEAAPTWQSGSNTRKVPDIAFDGDPNSGAAIYVKGKLAQIGGTSLSAPIFAALWGQVISNQTKTLSANPTASFYKYLPTNASLFNDIKSGSNGAYSAAAGWDYTTGFGSLNIANVSAFAAKTAGF